MIAQSAKRAYNKNYIAKPQLAVIAMHPQGE